MSFTLGAALNALPGPIRALVVGGTAGIGLGVAQQLCTHKSARVIIAGRNAEAARNACEATANKNMSFRRLDASLMRQVTQFCANLATDFESQDNAKLTILVLCQGIISARPDPTIEGIDVALALNYYSRMLIIRDLIASDTLAPDAIIISVLNARVGDPSGNSILWDDMDISRGIYGVFSIGKILKHNISMQDIMLQQLSAGSSRTFVHNYPGFVKTDILENAHLPGFIKWVIRLRGQNSSKYVSPEHAGEKIIVGAVECWQKQKETGRAWWYTDEKASEIIKSESPADVRSRVAQHTWELIGLALDKQASGASS